MINAYSIADGLLRKLDCSDDFAGLAGATWIDLLEPTREQEAAVEAALRVEIPTREEMRAIDESSQIYRDGAALVMSTRVLSISETFGRRLIGLTFLLVGDRPATLQYRAPTP